MVHDFFHQQVSLVVSCSWSLPVDVAHVARERLARLKSSLNLKLVRHYQDRQGNHKIQGGPHLTQSAEYPIQLGLKAATDVVLCVQFFCLGHLRPKYIYIYML